MIEVFGKPSAEYFRSVLSLLNASPSEVTIVGDDWKTDNKGAMAMGFKLALLKSEKYAEGDERFVPETLCLECLMDIL